MAALARRPWVRVILAVVFAEGLLLYGATAFIALDLHLRFGLSLGASGAIVAAFALGGLGYAAFAGRIVPRLGERGLASGGGAFIAASLLGLAAAPAAGWALPCMIGLGLGVYMLHNTLQTESTQMSPEVRGTAVALFASAFFLGQTVGVPLAAPVVDRYGAPVLFVIGDNDSRCPLQQALVYVDRLAVAGKPHEVYRYTTGHGSLDIDEEVRQIRAVLDFLQREVPGLLPA